MEYSRGHAQLPVEARARRVRVRVLVRARARWTGSERKGGRCGGRARVVGAEHVRVVNRERTCCSCKFEVGREPKRPLCAPTSPGRRRHRLAGTYTPRRREANVRLWWLCIAAPRNEEAAHARGCRDAMLVRLSLPAARASCALRRLDLHPLWRSGTGSRTARIPDAQPERRGALASRNSYTRVHRNSCTITKNERNGNGVGWD